MIIVQGYGQIKEALRALTKDDILKPYISDNDFRSSNDDDDIGYNLYIFDIRYQKKSQSVKVEFKFSEDAPAGIYGYTLVLRNKLFSISSDGQHHFDLISVIFNFFITSLFSFIDNSVFSSKASVYLPFKLSMP